ncbi:hypothetical protein, partial [Planomonospora parontospora]
RLDAITGLEVGWFLFVPISLVVGAWKTLPHRAHDGHGDILIETVSGIAPRLPAWVRLAVGDRARRRGCWIAPETVTALCRRKHSDPETCGLKEEGFLCGVWCRDLMFRAVSGMKGWDRSAHVPDLHEPRASAAMG